jgi:catechol 2,3-dioxygenase-like lactoylglutathione lyase family enzyme
MALHGLSDVTLGVPDVEAAKGFYREFGLTEGAAGRLATTDGGDQLAVVHRPYRQLVSYTIAAEDPDDIGRIARAAAAHGGLEVTHDADGSISIPDPVMGTTVRVAIRPRIVQERREPVLLNSVGNSARTRAGVDRAPGIFSSGPAQPRRLGHVLYGTPDIEASRKFLTEVLGFKVSDESGGFIAFLRCSTDHHNVGIAAAPIPFLHHTSWQVDDVDAIGNGAQHLLSSPSGDPSRSVWGLGRHFLGSNFFWYFRDPCGNYAEYFSDLDQIEDDAKWTAQDWDPSKSLNAWGPPVPSDFVPPADIEELVAAVKANAH